VKAGRITGVDPTARHLYPSAAIVAHAEAMWAQRRLVDVCVEHGDDYHRVWQWVKAQRLDVVQAGRGCAVLVPAATEAAIVDWLTRTAALRERAVPFSEAADLLRVSGPVIDALVRDGRLELDPERGDRGARHVTRTSITAYANHLDGIADA
jgi:hypothetical protein